MLNKFWQLRYAEASDLNKRNILALVSDKPYPWLCDLGCDDGEWTMLLAACSQSREVFGLEIVRERARTAQRRGIHASVANLESTFPFRDDSFHLVHANQVIEHVANLDHFLAETRRILKPNGTVIVSTENGSSWHNIFASIMGWQMFSLTNVSELAAGLGNPLSIHRGQAGPPASWTHKTILNFQGIIDLLNVHALKVIRVLGSGYHPFPAQVGRIDARHSHFLAIKALKQ